MYFTCLNFIPPQQGDSRIKGLLEKSDSNNTSYKGLELYGHIGNGSDMSNLYGNIENFYTSLKNINNFNLSELGEDLTGIEAGFTADCRILDLRPATHFMTLFSDGKIISFLPKSEVTNINNLTSDQILSISSRKTLELYYNMYPSIDVLSIDKYLDDYIVFKETALNYSFLDQVSYKNVVYIVVSREKINEDIQCIAIKINTEKGRVIPSTIKDFGVEIGRNENGTYQKFSDGRLICFVDIIWDLNLNPNELKLYSKQLPLEFTDKNYFVSSCNLGTINPINTRMVISKDTTSTTTNLAVVLSNPYANLIYVSSTQHKIEGYWR